MLLARETQARTAACDLSASPAGTRQKAQNTCAGLRSKDVNPSCVDGAHPTGRLSSVRFMVAANRPGPSAIKITTHAIILNPKYQNDIISIDNINMSIKGRRL